jgi:hypothetical protein
MKKAFGILGLVFLLIGCEKNIDIDLKESAPKLVVEGIIENDEYPTIILTKSVGYFSGLSPQVLAESFVRNAEVYVSNGTLTHKLKEYRIPVTPAISFYYYSVDSSSLATAFKGALNSSYSLRIITEGKTYTANTTIPSLRKRIDSIWSRPAPVPDSAKRNVLVRVSDPQGFGDYVRVFTKVNSGAFLPPFNSAFDDLFIDGTTYEVQMTRGIIRDGIRNNDEGGSQFNKGDTVTLKMSGIDKATYDFWQTLEYSYSSVGNPFSTPTKVKSNINNGALGYFGGYASQFKSIVIPK